KCVTALLLLNGMMTIFVLLEAQPAAVTSAPQTWNKELLLLKPCWKMLKKKFKSFTPCQVSNLLFLIFSGTPRVAFSAALPGSGNTGPFTTATPLTYKKVFSNTGNCYNPSTGIFTATVSGMYFFRFSMFNNMTPAPNSVVSLMKNSERLTSVWDTAATDIHDSGSNAVVISLKVGDNVYVQLEPNRAVYDDGMHYNTFSGFLLFPM
uniref:C1q domain-containing protein n=1 Tax=Xiphophorus couchianus TaxID=32473 RepID=A0A3B5MEK0_9TELE